MISNMINAQRQFRLSTNLSKTRSDTLIKKNITCIRRHKILVPRSGKFTTSLSDPSGNTTKSCRNEPFGRPGNSASGNAAEVDVATMNFKIRPLAQSRETKQVTVPDAQLSSTGSYDFRVEIYNF